MSTQPGTVTAYQFINNAWVQLGQKIVGNNGEQIGNVVSISGDGLIVAFGHNRGDNRSVRIFKYSGGSWSQLGDDINRENEYDEHGSDISLSDDGTIVAIGAAGNDGAGNRSGHVRVHQWDGSAWVQRGSDLDGEASGDNSGHSVSLSSDGTIVAIGAYGNYGGATASGHVRVYQWDGNTWVQLGPDIDGERVEDRSGYSVSLSNDGTILAIGSKDADKQENSPTNHGHVRVFQYSSGSWTQLGDDIDGEATSDYFGTSVSLSGDGTIFAASAPGNDDKDSDAGHVRVFKWNGSSWAKLGDNINGESAGDNSGGTEQNAISISNDGTKIAIGARLNDGAGANVGHTRIYQYRDPNVTLSSASLLPEVAGETVTVTATLEFASSSDVQVTLDSSGTATGGGTDYSLSSNTITIAAGQTTGTTIVTAVTDQTADDNETIILDISAVINAIEATAQQVTITITEDVCTASGGSELSGVISSDRTLYKSCSPYTVTNNLLVKEGVSLVIEPGVVIEVSPGKFIRVEGNIKAIGSASDSIEFKSTSSERWEGIKIRSAGGGVAYTQENYTPDSEFKYVNFSGYNKALYVWDSGIKVDHSKFTGTSGVEDYAMEIIRVEGININSSTFENHEAAITTKSGYSNEDDLGHLFSVHIKNSTFKNNNYGLYLPLNQKGLVDFQLTGNKFISNNIGFNIYGGTFGARIIKNNISDNIFYNNNFSMYFGNIQATCSTNDMYSCGMDSRLIAKYGLSDDEYPLRINKNIIINSKEIQANEINFQNGHLGSHGKINFSENIVSSSIGGIYINGPNSPGTYINNNFFETGKSVLHMRKDPSYPSYDARKVIFSNNTFNIKNSDNNEFYLSLSGEDNILNSNNFPKDDSLVYNYSDNAVNVEDNYWGTTTEFEIQASIYDYNDDFDLGEVDYTPFSTSPNTSAPISPPRNVKITRLANSVELSWDANTESDVAGYKLHYGTFTGYSYSNVLDLGNVTSKTVSISLAINDKLTITAYDNDADGTDDQIEGHESWFAEAEVVSAPIGVNDSYQIAAGSLIDITSGPFAHYQFDKDKDLTGAEDNQRVKDISGNGYDLGASYLSNRFVNDRFDKANQALKFEGNSMVSYQHDDAFNFKGQNEWSIYFWVKIDKHLQGRGLLSKFKPNTGWSFINMNGSNNDPNNWVDSKMEFYIIENQNYYLTHRFNKDLTEDEWNTLIPKWRQVAVTYNGSELKMYFDGSEVASSSANLPDITDSNTFNEPLRFGYSKQTSNGTLTLDDVRFYNRSLTILEIQDMYTETNVQSFQGVLANDIDLDGDTLTATLVETTTNGTLTLQDNGKFKYVPNANYSGNDNFTYKAFDGTYSSANTTVNISVSTPPVASDDSYSVDEDAVLTVDVASGVLSNDTDAESDVMTAVKLTDPTHGTLTFSVDGSFTYDHDGGASTSDSFTYQASDGIGNSNTATVTISIVASDDAPVANPDAYGTEQDEVLNITKEEGVLKNDVDEEGDAMTVELVTDVTLGTLTLDTDGSFNYTPPTGQKGIDTFKYKVKAAELFSNTTYATININGRPVIASNQTFNVDENKSNGFTVGQISIEDESSSFTWEILSGNQDNIFLIESNGTVKVNNSSALNYEKIETLTLSVKAHDGTMWSEARDVVININNIQDMSIISYELTHSYCSSGVGTGYISIEVEGEEGNDLQIDWSNGVQNSLYIDNLSAGTYSVTLTDEVGQTLSENYTINLLPMYQEVAVCFITADFDDYTRNRIYVNVGSNPYNVDKYLIYREGSQANVYDFIGEIDPSEEAFIDGGVDNRTKSFRYKVAMRDKCGNVSDLSDFQETSHLSANPGIDGNINLQWTAYKGLEFSTYEIYRKVNNGDFDSLTSVSSNSLAYSDVSISSENTYRYFVAIYAEVQCAPGGINIEFDEGDMVYGGFDLGNPTDLKGKKIVRPRTNQFLVEATDTDGDGVINDDDQCPETPEGETVDANGCSTSQIDSDGDGVTDDVDQCPETPTGETVDANGCSTSQLDSDGDGVINDDDQCPETPTGEAVDTNGCSDTQKDTDGDGVTDDKDECPDTPSGELVYLNGCSNSQLDSDGDGVTDDVDKCPDTPSGQTVDASGCIVPLFVESVTFIDKIYPNPTDNEITVELNGNPKIQKVEFVDFSGKKIKPNKLIRNQNILVINVSNLNEGVYLLNITTDKEINKVKVVIDR